MKQIATILLLALLVFNQFGYHFVSEFKQNLADEKIAVTIDKNNYTEEDLVTIKIPLYNGYQSDRPDFERVDGEILYNEVIYTYVKRKVLNGEIILKCLPNYEKMEVLSGRDGFMKLAYEYGKYPASNQTGHKAIAEYQQLKYNTDHYNQINVSLISINTKEFFELSENLRSISLSSLERPPILA